jgi:xylulokinase
VTVLGIDVGTGGTRAVVVDDDGHVVASATEAHQPFASPRPGWAEQDPADWWRACTVAVRTALGRTPDGAGPLAAVGLSGQMHGAVVLDEADEILRPSLIWCDQRTGPQCNALVDQLGEEQLVELTSNPPLTAFTLPKLLWIRDHEPKLWPQIRHVLLPKDYVRLWLTGEHATDVADASGTLLFDVARRCWSGPMLDAAGLAEAVLPTAYESADVTGRITSAAAEATGIPTGTPVVAGAGDQAAGAIGLGVVRPGAVSATIGTSGVVFAATELPTRDPRGRIHSFCHAARGRWHVMGVTQAAGLSLQWFAERFAPGSGEDLYECLTAEAAVVPPGSGGVLWAPYLLGERTPHLDPDARAALVGLNAGHERGHVVRAILEGVAFSLRDTLAIFDELSIPVDSIRLGGGGARSRLWRQIQADVYGREVEIVAAEEGAAYGAALLAGVGAGIWPSVEDACDELVRVAERVAPDPEAVAVLDGRYNLFRRLYGSLSSLTVNGRA